MELIKIGEKDDKIILSDKNGNTGCFRFIDMLRYGGKEYASIADDEDEIYIMEFIDGKKERYIEIENDSIFNTVIKLFEDLEE
ncbi:MAG: DUF1292 domain-containing protein [Oscillospiraceae bacterium]|nr:DUF1292 domain-containing protein [Oscillospiraceae bacterium]